MCSFRCLLYLHSIAKTFVIRVHGNSFTVVYVQDVQVNWNAMQPWSGLIFCDTYHIPQLHAVLGEKLITIMLLNFNCYKVLNHSLVVISSIPVFTSWFAPSSHVCSWALWEREMNTKRKSCRYRTYNTISLDMYAWMKWVITHSAGRNEQCSKFGGWGGQLESLSATEGVYIHANVVLRM